MQALRTFRLALKELLKEWKIALLLSLFLALIVMLLLVLDVYQSAMIQKYTVDPLGFLVVQSSQSLGEFYGSRLNQEIGLILEERGVASAIPEIRTMTGTKAKNAIMIRGIVPGKYETVEKFTLVAGQKLTKENHSRCAMIGWRLAKSSNLGLGDEILLRGRPFEIIGIFQTGTYMDNQAWISLGDAQELLGWGHDVSIYFVPDNGILKNGEQISIGVSALNKGDGLGFVRNQFLASFDLLQLSVSALSLSVLIGFTLMFWRLAWQKRLGIAIMRVNGFQLPSIFIYQGIQGLFISLAGILAGVIFTYAFTTLVSVLLPSFTLVPRLSLAIMVDKLGILFVFILAGILFPILRLVRYPLTSLLHAE